MYLDYSFLFYWLILSWLNTWRLSSPGTLCVLCRCRDQLILSPYNINIDNDYQALRQSEPHVTQEFHRNQKAHEETREDRTALKLLVRELGGQFWREGC